MRSIGLDIHRDFCEVAIAEGAEIRSAGRIEMTPAALQLFAQSLGADDRVALEVSGNAWEVARIIVLTPLGFEEGPDGARDLLALLGSPSNRANWQAIHEKLESARTPVRSEGAWVLVREASIPDRARRLPAHGKAPR